MNTGIISCVEIGYTESSLGIVTYLEICNLCNCPGSSMKRIGHGSECTVSVSADTVKVYFVCLKTGCFKCNVRDTRSVDTDRGINMIGVVI